MHLTLKKEATRPAGANILLAKRDRCHVALDAQQRHHRGFHNKMELISRQAYSFRNFENYRMRVKVLCGKTVLGLGSAPVFGVEPRAKGLAPRHGFEPRRNEFSGNQQVADSPICHIS